MQNKKYQIFVSSTYEDLKEERKVILETISTMGHLPIGMELFVASDEEQFEYIKRVIDNCDYYVLILGGRYGSISPVTNKSYTEMEYEYACSKGIPVLVFPYKNIENIIENKKDKDLTNISNFINKASNGRMCKFWETKDGLALNVINSLHKNFEEKPQRGWIRPDEFDNSELLGEINNLRKENNELKEKIKELETALTPAVKDIADMDEMFELHYLSVNSAGYSSHNKFAVSWNDMFSYIAPKLISPISASRFEYLIDRDFFNKYGYNYQKTYINSDDAQTIKIQWLSYGLLNAYSANMVNGGIAEFVQLTKKGLSYLKQLKTIKTAK